MLKSITEWCLISLYFRWLTQLQLCSLPNNWSIASGRFICGSGLSEEKLVGGPCSVTFHFIRKLLYLIQCKNTYNAQQMKFMRLRRKYKSRWRNMLKFSSAGKPYQNLVTLESTGQWTWLNRSRTVTYVGMWCSICWQQSCGYMWWLWPRGWERQGGCWRRCEWPGSWTGTS